MRTTEAVKRYREILLARALKADRELDRMECPYCGEIELPRDGGECRECHRITNL